MTSITIYESHAEVCKALGHPLRIQIIDLLQEDELCFSDIMEITGGLESNLSQHLSGMVKKGILKQRKEEQNVYFKLFSTKVAKALGLMCQVLVDYLKSQQKLLKKYK